MRTHTLLALLATSLFAETDPVAIHTTTYKKPTPSVECPPVTQLGCTDLFKPTEISCEVFGSCLILQPMLTSTYYAAQAIGINPAYTGLASIVSPDWKILDINPDYHVGFDVGFDVNFHTQLFDMKVNWERLQASDSESYQASLANGVMVGSIYDIGPNAAAYKTANGHLISHFDEVNLRFGRRVCFFNCFHTHFYGGAGFLRVYQSLTSNYSNEAADRTRKISTSSTFMGGGPQIGLDYEYRIGKGFSFIGSSVLPFFMGQMQGTANYQSTTPSLTSIGYPQPNLQETTIPSRVQLIPGFEQKLGFNYAYTWCNVKALLEVGYQCQIYLNAVQTTNMITQAVPVTLIDFPDTGLYAQGYSLDSSNYMLTGPYVTFALEF